MHREDDDDDVDDDEEVVWALHVLRRFHEKDATNRRIRGTLRKEHRGEKKRKEKKRKRS